MPARLGPSMRASEIPKMDVSLWKKIGEFAKGRIIADADKGIFQNDKRNISYSNSGANVGWRTIGSGSNAKRVYIDSYINYKKRGMTIPGYGKISKYKGVSVDRGKSGKVNARLTGETLRRITTKATKNYAELNFARGAVVEGLKKNKNADLADIRAKNLSSVSEKISKHLETRIKKFAAKDTVIKIG